MPELRDLPAVDALLSHDDLADLINQQGVQTVRNEIRRMQQAMRDAREVPEWAIEPSQYRNRITQTLTPTRYQPVFNMTGTVIHTNLGRALLSRDLWNRVEPLVTRPMNLEFDITAGKRGNRDLIIEQRLQSLTGCEAATVVNNNAAALMLVLNTFALGKNVPVSRGELIEIGGSFRLPELMSRSGCQLVEVGTTNRTHLKDYEAAADKAALMLKVHPSNYHIDGFTKSVTAAELAKLADQHDIPSCVDLGAGTLVDLGHWGLPVEPTPQSVMQQGIGLVTFSGDKLLGGVQSGIIVGRKSLVDQLNANPLKRALRADKITMAILEETLKLYEQPDQLPANLPLLKTLTASESSLREVAQKVCTAIPPTYETTVTESRAQIGSGALPDQDIASIAVTLLHTQKNANEVQRLLRELSTPVIARVADDKVWLDMRGAEPLDELINLLAQLPQ